MSENTNVYPPSTPSHYGSLYHSPDYYASHHLSSHIGSRAPSPKGFYPAPQMLGSPDNHFRYIPGLPYPTLHIPSGVCPSTPVHPSPISRTQSGAAVPSPQPVLQPTQSIIINSLVPRSGNKSATNTAPKRKTATNGSGGPAAKRKKANNSASVDTSTQPSDTPPIITASHCGVGPVDPPGDAAGPGAGTMGDSASSTRANSASDVWYFLRPLKNNGVPSVWPETGSEKPLFDNPKSDYVGCKLCTKDWKVWRNKEGMTGTIRNHLQKYHGTIYEKTCVTLRLKHAEKIATQSSGSEENGLDKMPFTLEMLYSLILRWVVADDQSLNIVECQEFRDILVYLGQGQVKDDDILGRTKLTQDILRNFKKKQMDLRQDLAASLGRISYTMDLWSDTNLNSFMAVTASYIIEKENGRLEMRTRLVAFRHIKGSHSGEHLADEFFKIVEELGVLHKIGEITMDNASNNNTCMVRLQVLLTRRQIPFDSDGNRIRCFPHVVNLACQAVIDGLKNPPSTLCTQSLPHLRIYRDILMGDLIGYVRRVVKTCRSSGQRRQELKSIISEGNQQGWWKEKIKASLQLLRDCETRWSSTFLMANRFKDLYSAVEVFLRRLDNSDLPALTKQQLGVLDDILQMLEIPHRCQELLSSERTPTLSFALPVYEDLISQWKELSSVIPELSSFIGLGITKIEEYLAQARKTRIYVHAMVVNPRMKFNWLQKHRTSEEVEEAREWIRESMLKFQQHQRQKAHTSTASITTSSSQPLSRASSSSSCLSAASTATQSLASGLNRLRGLNANIRRSTVFSTTTSDSTPSIVTGSTLDGFCNREDEVSINGSGTLSTPQEESTEARVARELAEDKAVVTAELKLYEQAATPDDIPSEYTNDLIRLWEVYRYRFPLLFRVAMDVLPAQASAVPCERVFSSSKETCTLRRSRISPELMEALQVLKFDFREDRLNFMTHWGIAHEQDYAIDGVTDVAMMELLAAGEWDVLQDLLNNEVKVLEILPDSYDDFDW